MFEERFPYHPVHLSEAHYGYTRRSARFDRLFRERRYDLVHAHFGT
jgi:hypothetical protein